MKRFRSARAKSPKRGYHGVGDAFSDPNETSEDIALEFDDDERDGETNEGASKDVGRVVSADEDSTDSDEDCRREEDGAHEAIEEEDREGDREGRAGVVAREGGIVRPRPPHMRRGVGGKRPLPMPDLADHLIG